VSGISDVEAWFKDKGFGIVVHQDGEADWGADLTRLRTGEIVAPLYGRGDSADSAALSARDRYETEQ
jgi:hypothetical protein